VSTVSERQVNHVWTDVDLISLYIACGEILLRILAGEPGVLSVIFSPVPSQWNWIVSCEPASVLPRTNCWYYSSTIVDITAYNCRYYNSTIADITTLQLLILQLYNCWYYSSTIADITALQFRVRNIEWMCVYITQVNSCGNVKGNILFTVTIVRWFQILKKKIALC